MTTLTRDDIIEAIEKFWAANSYGPTIRKLAAALGLLPGNHVSLFRRVEGMVADGDLIWPLANGKHVANTLRVTDRRAEQ